MELTNIHQGAVDELYKVASINLSPNTMGQVSGLWLGCDNSRKSLFAQTAGSHGTSEGLSVHTGVHVSLQPACNLSVSKVCKNWVQELPTDASNAVLGRLPFNFQIALSIMVNPPKPGDESYEQYWQERNAEIASLRRRAHMVTDGFNALEGVTCNFTEGAMYSFPRVSGCFRVAAVRWDRRGSKREWWWGGWLAGRMEGSTAGLGGCYGAVMQALFPAVS